MVPDHANALGDRFEAVLAVASSIHAFRAEKPMSVAGPQREQVTRGESALGCALFWGWRSFIAPAFAQCTR
jgi:hypothetical protein